MIFKKLIFRFNSWYTTDLKLDAETFFIWITVVMIELYLSTALSNVSKFRLNEFLVNK